MNDNYEIQAQAMVDSVKSYYNSKIMKLILVLIVMFFFMLGSIVYLITFFSKEYHKMKNEFTNKYSQQIENLEKEKKEILNSAFEVKNHLINQYYITDHQQYEQFMMKSSKFIQSVYSKSKIDKKNKLTNKEMIEVLDIVFKGANRVGIDPYLITAIIYVESSFNKRAVSKAGAMGLMQLMPYTARLLANNPGNYSILTTPKYYSKILYNPIYNVKLGIRYLKDLFEIFDGRIDWTLFAYNYGPYYVKKYFYDKEKYVTDLKDKYVQYPSKVINILNKVKKGEL